MSRQVTDLQLGNTKTKSDVIEKNEKSQRLLDTNLPYPIIYFVLPVC